MERIVVPVTTPAAADAIAALSVRADVEVIGVVVDVGNATGSDALRAVALGAGALRCHVLDVRESFAAGVLWPAIRAGALGAPGEPIVTALSMPAVALAALEITGHEQATSIAAFAEDPRERQRLHALLRALAPTMGVVTVGCATPALVEQNLWGRVAVVPADGAAAARPAADVPPAHLVVGFARGLPVSLSGVTMPPAELVESLGTIARAHGVRPWLIAPEESSVRRWAVDAPAALALHRAGEALAARTLDRRTAAFAAVVAGEYAALVRDGAWFSPLRTGLDGFIERALASATGDVTVRMAHGEIDVQA